MKFLKGLLILIVILIAVAVIAGLIMPKDYKLERSVVIPTCSGVVYEQIADFRNWNNWSPWKERDSSITAEYSENQKAAGAMWSWKGDPEMTGEGEMTATTLTDTEITYHLKFIKPFESESDGFVRVESLGDSTRVTWGMFGRNGFPSNVIMGFMGGMDAMVGKDFELGLELLSKKALEVEIVKAETIEIQELNYIGKRFTTPLDSISQEMFSAAYAEIGAYMAANKLSKAGSPISISHHFDEASRTMDLEVAMPYFGVATPQNGLNIGVIPGGKALKHTYIGAYDNLEAEWGKFMTYATCVGVRPRFAYYESYVTDPSNATDPNKLHTDLIWPIE